MKPYFFIFHCTFLLLIWLSGISQTTITDTTVIRGRTRDLTFMFDKPDFNEGKSITPLKKEEFVYIIKIVQSKNPRPYPYWYYCIYNGDEGYVPSAQVDIYGNFTDEKYKYLLSTDNYDQRLSISKKLSLKDKQRFDSIAIAEKNESDSLSKLFDSSQKNLVEKLSKLVSREKILIVSHSYPLSETLHYPGFKIRFVNGSQKKIRYVWFKINAYNAVNDIEESKELRCIGPVESFNNKVYEFENVFISKVIDHCEINSVKIQYMDNTVLTLSGSSLSIVFLKLSLDNFPELESTLRELYFTHLKTTKP